MWGHDHRQYEPNVVAVFDSQDDADEAVLQLRIAGFRDDQIGYFGRNQFGGWARLLDRDYGAAGAVIGWVAGLALGIGMAWLVSRWSERALDLTDFFGVAVTLGTFVSLFGALIGWGIGEGVRKRSVAAPDMDPSVAAFVVEVATGGTSDPDLMRMRAWDAIHARGGRAIPAGAMAARPIVV